LFTALRIVGVAVRIELDELAATIPKLPHFATSGTSAVWNPFLPVSSAANHSKPVRRDV
jgi:hypothetical protein